MKPIPTIEDVLGRLKTSVITDAFTDQDIAQTIIRKVTLMIAGEGAAVANTRTVEIIHLRKYATHLRVAHVRMMMIMRHLMHHPE